MSDLRAKIAEALRATFDREAIGEWICCDPINPNHILCQQGDTTRTMARALLADDPDAFPERSRVVDAVMGVVEARLNELEAECDRQASGDPWDYGYLRAIKDMRGEK